jgi:hypothetical protein
MRLFSGLFWGVLLVASGAILLLKYSLNLQIAQGKLIFGVFVILVGVSLLTSNINIGRSDNTAIFSDGQVVMPQSGGEYNTVFGSNSYDLSDVAPGSYVKVNCAFGSVRVKMPPGAYEVKANCAFGSVRMPNGTSYAFGGGNYNKQGPGDTTTVEVSCAFGELILYE